jgi:hypothetical protein
MTTTRRGSRADQGDGPQPRSARIQTGRKGLLSASVLYRASLLLHQADSGFHYDFERLNSKNRGLEDYPMHRAHRCVSALFLTAALAGSGSIVAARAPQEAGVQVRIYDSHHHDYHNWDDREDRAYRGYLAERHEEYRAYHKQNHKNQKNYWNWRHSHPDHD